MNSVKVEWIKQLGTAGEDDACGIALDRTGQIYITGYTSGSLGGDNAGGSDVWIAKYDKNGLQLWLKQLGGDEEDEAGGITVDLEGNAYIIGYTHKLATPTPPPTEAETETNPTTTTTDKIELVRTGEIATAWLAKYDTTGNQQWLKKLSNPLPQIPQSIGVDRRGDIYMTGYSIPEQGNWEAWLAKYDPDGQQLWWLPLGKYNQEPTTSVTVSERNTLYLAGNTIMPIQGEEEGHYTWVARYSGEGIQRWIKAIGKAEEVCCSAIASDTNQNCYVVGYTENSIAEANAGGNDAWVAKYDANGNQQWLHQLGSTDDEESTDVALDPQGNVYVTGFTYGNLEGENAGDADAWVAKYSPYGIQQWVKQIGSSGEDGANGVATDSEGNIYVTGYTDGNLQGENAGGYDAWLAKLVQAP